MRSTAPKTSPIGSTKKKTRKERKKAARQAERTEKAAQKQAAARAGQEKDGKTGRKLDVHHTISSFIAAATVIHIACTYTAITRVKVCARGHDLR